MQSFKIKRVVVGDMCYPPPGSPLVITEVYASQWHLDRQEALEAIPNSHEAMWEDGLSDVETDTSDASPVEE